MKKLKVIMIGCGNIAGGYDANAAASAAPLTHAGAYLAHGGFEIIACCDPDPQKRSAFQQHWGAPIAVADPAELDELHLQADVVSICSPTALHAEHLRTALQWQPKLIFCEKPIAISVEDAEQCLLLCRQAGIPLAVNYTRRWAPDIRALQQELTNQHWGAVRSITGTYNKGILNNGSHLIDLLHYLFGSLIILATGRSVYDFWPDDPSIPVLLETQDGLPITLNIAHAQDYALFEIQLTTERGVLRMENGGLSWSNRTVIDSPDFPGYRSLDNAQAQPGRYREAMLAAVDNLYQFITASTPLLSTGDTAIQAQTICNQIRALSLKTPFPSRISP